MSGKQETSRRKVFGIGLNKTGTTTLATCMQRLGYRHMGYRLDLLKQLKAGRLDDVFRVTDEYDSFDDWPYPLIYRELADRYPDALFILTTRRSSEVWLSSLRKHSRQSDPFRNARKLSYGYRYPDTAPEQHIALYERHNAEVKRYLGSRVKELCWENGDGWKDLCEFIGSDVPDEPLPHVNASLRPSFKKQIANSLLQKVEALVRSQPLVLRAPDRPATQGTSPQDGEIAGTPSRHHT